MSGSSPSSPTRPARSAWTRCSARSRSTRRRASSTSRSTTTCCCPTPRARTARSSRRASPRPARWPASSRPAPPTPTGACRWCRSSSSIRCSASSASATSIWAAADARARGFLLGATAGRTTLTGEGLQHQDGHSLLLASTVPTVEAYDPALRLRGRAHRPGRDSTACTGRTRPTASATSSTTSPSTTRRSRCRPCRRRTGLPAITSSWVSSRACTAGPTLPRDPRSGPRSSSPARPTAPRPRRATSSPSGGTWPATSGRSRATRSSASRPWSPNGGTASTPARNPARRWSRPAPSTAPTPAPRRRRHRLHAGRARPGVALGRPAVHVARHRRLRTLRHPRGAAQFFEVDAGHIVVAVLASLADQGEVETEVVADAIAAHGIDPEVAPPWTH